MAEALEVAELWRYPVKALRGERLERADVNGDGIRGDRKLRVEDDQGLVTARTRPGLLGLEAVVGPDGEPMVNGDPWQSASASDAVAQVAPGCRLVSTEGAPVGLRFDLAPVLVLTTSIVAELGVDHRRLRPNVLIDGARGREEADWVGARLTVGSAVLEVVSRCERCVVTTFDPDTLEQDPAVLRRINEAFGGYLALNCNVVEPGAVSIGDAVGLEPGPG